MGRWADMDGDESRLPEGVKRIGYDADSQKYTFFEASTGKYYESAAGNRYGVLQPIAHPNDHRCFFESSVPRRSKTYAGPRRSRRDSSFSDQSTLAGSIHSSIKKKDFVKDFENMEKDETASRRSSTSSERSVSPSPLRRLAQPGTRRARAQTFEGILNEPRSNVGEDSGNREAYRTMLPFALLVLTVLLLLFRFVGFGSEETRADGEHSQVRCQKDFETLRIAEGDTCWKVSERHGVGLDEFLSWMGNEGLDCDNLRVGQDVCIPE